MPRHENTIRAGALTLLCFTDMSTAMVSRLTGINEHRLRTLKSNAIERGFDPRVDCRIYERFVEDSPRSGRPKKTTPTQEKQIIDSVTANCAGHEKSAEVLTFESGILCYFAP